MKPVIDHIQITVRDMSVAVPFYDRLMPLLGFNPKCRTSATIDEHEFHVVEYSHPLLAFAITSPRSAFEQDSINRRKPGALHHLAFKAESRAEVDRLHSDLKNIGATIVTPPREYPEYTPPGYYALFFKDPDGIKYEIVCTRIDQARDDIEDSSLSRTTRAAETASRSPFVRNPTETTTRNVATGAKKGRTRG